MASIKCISFQEFRQEYELVKLTEENHPRFNAGELPHITKVGKCYE
jgi:hypothetical protein